MNNNISIIINIVIDNINHICYLNNRISINIIIVYNIIIIIIKDYNYNKYLYNY